jgi:two-component system, chemotaxis family, chemotaxis protein CheV
MAGILDAVDLRTQLVGENRLELLMFRLMGNQLFAINVFKVQEVQRLPALTMIPQSHPAIAGVIYTRGRTIPVIDLSCAVGLEPINQQDKCSVIVTEYNASIQGFLVKAVDRIINLTWSQIIPPPKGTGKEHYLTSLTKIDDSIVEIIDVEKVLVKFRTYTTDVSDGVIDQELKNFAQGKRVLLVDDSIVAIQQSKSVLLKMGFIIETESDGARALKKLQGLVDSGIDVSEHYAFMITDAEMPAMDGYRLTHECRENPKLKNLYIVMQTSLSGHFNHAMVAKVGCNDFISKFQPDKLAYVVQKRLRELFSLASKRAKF